jgi:hypothetical protein
MNATNLPARFLEFLGRKAGEDLDALKVNDVLRYRDYAGKRLSATSTNMELKVLRACLYSAQKQDLVEKNVAKVDILKQRGETKRRGFTAVGARAARTHSLPDGLKMNCLKVTAGCETE